MRAGRAGAWLAGVAVALGVWAATGARAAGPGLEDSPPAAGLVLPPEAPAGIHAVPGDGQATVSWRAPFDGGSPITSYTVTASPAGPLVEVDGRTTTGCVTALINGTEDMVTVTAANAVGASPPSAPSLSVRPAPAPPGAAPADTPLALTSDADTAGLAPAALEPPPPLTPSPAPSVASLGPRADRAAAAGVGPGRVSVPSAPAVPEARP